MKTLVCFFFCSMLAFTTSAQECILGIGGKDAETLVKVFQMNEEQSQKLETLRAELEVETRLIEDEIKLLFDTHPQSTPEELTTLADKYKKLEAKMARTSYSYDKKLLQIFNAKQYERYSSLCKEASRTPIALDPQ